jgi:prophage regulatory protein
MNEPSSQPRLVGGENRLLSPDTVGNLTTLSRTTIWRLTKAGSFPKPVRVSAGRVAYRANDIDAWLNDIAQAA